jgi:hypothetical protein
MLYSPVVRFEHPKWVGMKALWAAQDDRGDHATPPSRPDSEV